MKFIGKIRSSKVFKKVAAVVTSACMAVSMVAVNAFAAEGDSSVASVSSALGDIGPKLLSAFSDIVSACVDIGVSVIPLGLSIFGAIKLWEVAKRFFTKATN